ncbi:MAG: aldo/keto reductase [Campylobacterota bacterium]
MATTATKDGTYAFAKQFSGYKDFYLPHNGLYFSKLGLGTFNKEPYKEENYDFDYIASVKEAIANGINFIDTASNYRYGESEKDIGKALDELISSGEVKRQNLIIASKGGFIPLEYPFPKNPYRWIEKNIIEKGLAKEEDIELDQHCMSPDFLEHSCRQSLQNLGVQALDIYFLHNPEMQLMKLGYDRFLRHVEAVFERFEALADEGIIKAYGVAVWNGFFESAEKQEHINLSDLVTIAQNVGGKNHRFAYIQAPFNLAKTQAQTQAGQQLDDGSRVSLLQAAKELGIGVISSCSLLQMNLFAKPFKPEVGYILDRQMRLQSDIQLALQYVRSCPGVITSLFASKDRDHIAHNCEIANTKAVQPKLYQLLYKV